MEPLLPKPKPHPQWNSLDATGICSCSSAYRRFREWSDAGVFEEFWKQGVKRSLLTEAKGIPLSVVVDGAVPIVTT